MKRTSKMPILFFGHGSPMNAIANNAYTNSIREVGAKLLRPNAILIVSAHWGTNGTYLTSSLTPKTIHDFGGFPEKLFQIQYPAAGSAELVQSVVDNITDPIIKLDNGQWGFDHGAWSVLCHLYPKANIPVVQLSMDMTKPAEYHFEMGKKIKYLREQGILIVGSGNIVHNLRLIEWDEKASVCDWASEYDQWIKEKIIDRDFNSLIYDFAKTENGKKCNPTFDHYFPLLYILGAMDENDKINFFYEGIQNASIAMRSFVCSGDVV